MELTANERKVVIVERQKMMYTLFSFSTEIQNILSIKFSLLHSSSSLISSTLSLSFSSSYFSDLSATVSGASQPLPSSKVSEHLVGNG